MIDFRKRYIINISAAYLNITLEEKAWNEDIHSLELLEEFLETENCLILCLTSLGTNESKKLKLFKEVLPQAQATLIFYKHRPVILTDNNLLTSITLTTTQGSSTVACYNTLSKVFFPLLTKNKNDIPQQVNIEQHLNNLETDLRSIILTTDNENVDASSLTVINSLSHEVEYWENIKKTSNSNEKQMSSTSYIGLIQPLSQEFNLLDTLPISEIEDVLENAHNTLDDLWKFEIPYPRAKTVLLMDLIANEIINAISKKLSGVTVWSEEFTIMSDVLSQCLSTANKWIKSCKELTELFWPNYSLHPWSGEPYLPPSLKNVADGIEAVLVIRTVHRQVTRLLTVNEQNDLNIRDMFTPFRELDVLMYGPYSEQKWAKASKQFEYLLKPAEQRVAMKLKTQMSNMSDNSRQLIHEYGRYTELIQRPVVKETMISERNYFLSILNDYVKSLATQMNDVPTLSTKLNISPVVNEIQASRQLESKANEVKRIAQCILSDLSGYSDLHENVSELIKDLKQHHSELFDTWTSELNALIQSNTLSLRETDPVVQFNQTKLMTVNYSPRLVILITEVRQLTTLGYSILPNIIEISLHAKKFMSHAKTLEQIANFHNSIGDRMIPSQRPMMLASALQLTKLVEEEVVVAWGEIKSVEKYTNNLKIAVDKLSKENSLLSEYHYKIIDKINSLKNIDLIKYYQKWKDAAKYMRDIMHQVQQKGFKSMNVWKKYIDQCLCKVLEEQYIRSLDSVHLYLPEIFTELIYRNKELQFSPDENTIRIKYENQLKTFLEIPKNFRGVSDSTEGNVFSEIVDRNVDKLKNISNNTDNLFEQLKGVKKHWQSWISLEKLDTKKFINWQHWDLHFRASKIFGQEITKLPSTEERVGCFIVGLTRLRADLESYNRSYWDQLVDSLKSSIIENVSNLQEYVDSSTVTLNKQPVSLDELTDNDSTHSDILQKRPESETSYKEIIQQAHILASWSREKIDAVNRLQTSWDRLQNLLENHQHIIAKQVELVQTTLNVASKNLNTEIERFSAKWEQVKPRPSSGQIASDSLSELSKHLQNIKEKQEQWSSLEEQQTKLLGDFKRFNMDEPEFTLTNEISNDLQKEVEIWSLYEEFCKDLDELRNVEWIVFRKKSFKLEDFLQDWQTKLQKLESNALITRILQEIHKYQDILPLLKYVKGEDFTEKHWLEIYALINIEAKSIDALLLKDLLDASDGLLAHFNEIQAISKRAAGEIIIRQALAELDQWDVQAQFILMKHVDSKGIELFLIKDFKEILGNIGDNQSILQSVKITGDNDFFAERAAAWEKRLIDLDKNITLLAKVQRKWIYLEPIFGSGILGQDKVRFQRVDQDFRNILKFINKEIRVCALARYPNLISLLENCIDQLQRCQTSLEEFLANKRNMFPRFLFLGDDDLLEVIGQSSKEQVIQSHLKKIFAGINNIELSEDGKEIIAMCSSCREIVPLKKSVNIDRPVEEWMNTLVSEMQISLKDLLVQCLMDGNSADPVKYPSQILGLADSITFTTKCEESINNMSLLLLLNSYKGRLTQYSAMKLGGATDNSTSDILEIKLKALILDTIHHIDVIQFLVDSGITKVQEWYWQKQLRYYMDSFGEVTIKMSNATMEYAYEYIGNPQKLVRTPLTERCFLTLTQGMHLGMGGNPYGPAGTGKTESVKALGSLLGRQVLVFNCDEGIDGASMGRILSGLVRSGAWGCFDEFNRLDEATLSTVSMYIQSIQNSLQKQSSTVNLLNSDISVNKHCGIFVTLNPAGEGYGGRNKLPDNLKLLFRPIVMIHPDKEQIARTLLYCDGFKYAEIVAKKLVELFDSAGKLLSCQQHYDWGLRALRTVLSVCGESIKKYCLENTATLTVEDELCIAVKSLKIDTLSKLTYEDKIKFNLLIEDIFPDVKLPELANGPLLNLLQQCCEEMSLLYSEKQVEKCLELYEQLKQRMGVSIVGPPSSGKSTIRNLLFMALAKLGMTVKSYIFNPKSMSREKLLGQIDTDTRQWTDGVLTKYGLLVTTEPPEIWSWITCDGDVDPDWIESLNSLMDDNRLLTLPSGWRIQFGNNVNFIFETHDLSFASPATISRLGIVFLSEEDFSVDDYISHYVVRNEISNTFITDYFKPALTWCIEEADFSIPTSKLAIASTSLAFINNPDTKLEFLVRIVNSLGGQLKTDFQEPFIEKVFELARELAPAVKENLHYIKENDTIDTYYTDFNQIIKNIDDYLPLVLTASVRTTIEVIERWFESSDEQHLLLVGPHGSAKTLILERIINNRDDIAMITIHCSANVSPQYVLQKLQQNCIIVHGTNGRIFKPKKGKLVLHLKNLHLLKPDKWGTSILLAFLQQLITYKGIYDDSLEWVHVDNVIIVGTSSGTGQLTERFTSIVHNYTVDVPTNVDLTCIFAVYLVNALKSSTQNTSTWGKEKCTKLANTMITIYNTIRSTFNNIEHANIVINPHDITKWCEGIVRYKFQSSDAENGILEIVSYEAVRIFGDRLTKDKDRISLDLIIDNVIKNDWSKISITGNLKKCYYVPSAELRSRNQLSPLIKLNLDDWSTIIKKGIYQYEREGEKMDIEITPEIQYLTSCLSRALTISGGCALLVGSSGSGRKSAIKIVSAMQGAKLFKPISINQPQLNNEFKQAMQYAGIEGYEVYLVLEDHIIGHDDIVNSINTLLSSGEIPGLYNTVELESLTVGLKDEASGEGYNGSLIDYFFKQIKNKLHVIITIDSQNEYLANFVQNIPIFNQRSTTICMDKWSNNTMDIIPKLLINRILTNTNDQNNETLETFSKVHNSIKNDNVSPSKYIAFIKTYIDLYMEKKATILEKQQKLQIGVSKLTDAKNIVSKLKESATIQQDKLEEKQAKANKALDMISNTMKNANIQKDEMEILKKKTEMENIEIVKRKQKIEEELSEVEPLIQESRSAVGNIKTESLSEIRSLRAPPETIRDILEGVLRLMGIQDTSWNSMKTFLAKRGVKEDIRSFDAGRITAESRVAVERLMASKAGSFDPVTAKRASVAAAPLASWVRANVRYAAVLDKIRPLEREQNKLMQNLSEADSQLEKLCEGLSDVDATVLKLKGELSKFTKEAAEIEIDLNNAEQRLSAAEGLVEKLNDEYERWKLQDTDFSKQLLQLPKLCVLSSAFITYLAVESEDVRNNTINSWIQILQQESSDVNIDDFLSTERQRVQWQSQGLPTDQLSIQNGIIILKTKLRPLILDSTSVALAWMKTYFKDTNLECITPNSEKFYTVLELCVRFGKILLIEEIESIDPILFPILRKEFICEGERRLIRLNGKFIDYHKDFQLFMFSRNTQIKLTSNISLMINVVNFITTRVGLTEQLLISAIKSENPHLEERRKELLRNNEELQEKLFDLQSQLLDNLANSTGDILQNKELLSSLNETKASSTEITRALAESSIIHAKLQEEYNVYKDISSFGSTLYFAAAEFSKSNIMYTFSIYSFSQLFLKSIQGIDGNNSTFSSNKSLIYSIYQYMGRSIFKADRLAFLLNLCHKLFTKEIPDEEWNFFLGSTVDNKLHSNTNNEVDNLSWLPNSVIQSIHLLQSILPGLYSTLRLKEQSLWQQFYNSPTCENSFPAHCNITEFQKVLVVQIIRNDRVYSASKQCALRLTGMTSLNVNIPQISEIAKESVAHQPILMITTSGNDPSKDIRETAKTLIEDEQYIEIAMGQGQEDTAISNLHKLANRGGWLVLKNVHLVTSWLPNLNQNLQGLTLHENFRLWLITEEHSLFNAVLAQNCLKIACEAPEGIQNNLCRMLSSSNNVSLNPPTTTNCRIFFVFSYLHTIIQERSKYVPQGWSKLYDFNDTDFKTIVNLAKNNWTSSPTPWSLLSGLYLEAVYGGRIETKYDENIMESYLRSYFTDEVLSHRWTPLNMNKPLPSSGNIKDYINSILQLPVGDYTSYFGLPDNINQVWENNAFESVLKNLKGLALEKYISPKYDRESWLKKLTPYLLLWKKLNHDHDFVRKTVFANTDCADVENSLHNFVQNEYICAITLVQKIHKYFIILNKILKGSLNIDNIDIEAATSLLQHVTPVEWLKDYNGPKDIVKYLTNIINKTIRISEWKDKSSNDIYKVPVNLASFLRPETFIAAFKQEYARKRKIPMDRLILNNEWTRTAENSIILSDLLIEGAVFDGSTGLSSCSSNTASSNPVQHCFINWKEIDRDGIQDMKFISLPLYQSSSRQKQIASLKVACDFKSWDKWIQAGVAFFLND